VDTNNVAPYAAIAGAIAGLIVGVGWTWFVGRRTRTSGQASFVAAWLSPASAVLMNASDLPVFGVVVWFVDPAAAIRVPVTLPMLGPGRREVELPAGFAERRGEARPHPADSVGVEIAFSDAAGRHWLRRADGGLESLPEAPLRHYGLTDPDREGAHAARDPGDRASPAS
jgi:hypothetical protein